MSTASQRLLDAAAAAQDGATDYRLHKLSGYAQNTVSRWRTGSGHMGPGAVFKFCQLAGIRDAMRWQIEIGCEREQGPDGDVWRALRDDLTLATETGKPPRGGLIDSMMRTIAGKAAGVLLASLLLSGALFPVESRASEPRALQDTVYYVKRARARRNRRKPGRTLHLPPPIAARAA